MTQNISKLIYTFLQNNHKFNDVDPKKAEIPGWIPADEANNVKGELPIDMDDTVIQYNIAI